MRDLALGGHGLMLARMVDAYIALGSNIGDRAGRLDGAVEKLRKLPDVKVLAQSRWHETEPVDAPAGSGKFLNGALRISTQLPAAELLAALLKIEKELGRTRGGEKNGPRSIDLDLIFYGSESYNDDSMHVPHPRMQARRFVLEPLAEIAPGVRHPVLGKTVRELLAELDTGVKA